MINVPNLMISYTNLSLLTKTDTHPCYDNLKANHTGMIMNTPPVQHTMTEPFMVTGLRVRTNNNAEMTPQTGKIGGLWESFYTQLSPRLNESDQAHIYGVYTGYESDHTGAFDVVAGVKNPVINTQTTDLDSELSSQLTTVAVQSGSYLVFSGEGELPQTVISLWQDIWHYFTQNHCPHRRKYSTDFEHYTSNHAVDIYIAIE